MARAQGARSHAALAFESTYGTAPLSGYFRMPFARNTLGAGQPLLDNELLGFGRDPIDPAQDVITVDGALVVPIDPRYFGIWLKGAFGAPVSTENLGIYTHVFDSAAATLPSMSIEKGMPETPLFSMSSGCKVNRLGWNMQRSGHLQATVNLFAQGEADAATTQAGILSELTLARFGQFNGSISRDGSQMANVVSAEVGYTNNLDRVETIRDDGKIDGLDTGMGALTGQLKVRFASTTLLDLATNGTPSALKFELKRTDDELFRLDVPRVFLPRPKTQIEGPAGIEVTFEWQAAQDNGSPMCTATLINDVVAY